MSGITWSEKVLMKAVLEAHRKWVPEKFAKPVAGKKNFYFDPYEYTYLNKETREFIDGKK